MSNLPGADGEMHAMFNAYPSHKVAYQTYVSVLTELEKQIKTYFSVKTG
jgi:hypothetical protein